MNTLLQAYVVVCALSAVQMARMLLVVGFKKQANVRACLLFSRNAVGGSRSRSSTCC